MSGYSGHLDRCPTVILCQEALPRALAYSSATGDASSAAPSFHDLDLHRISQRVEQSRSQLQAIRQRVSLAQAKIEKIKGSKKAIKVVPPSPLPPTLLPPTGLSSLQGPQQPLRCLRATLSSLQPQWSQAHPCVCRSSPVPSTQLPSGCRNTTPSSQVPRTLTYRGGHATGSRASTAPWMSGPCRCQGTCPGGPLKGSVPQRDESGVGELHRAQG